jgi:uncharacterized protein YndB with AHSA1/START domain
VILIGAAVIVAGFLLIVAMKRPEFRLARSITIAAPAAAVFEQVNDFRKWRAWSPWEKLDPLQRRTYEGPAAGKGSVYSWIGNKKVGAGRMTVVESRPGELIRLKLEFLKPFKATNEAVFTFEPRGAGEQTLVTWSMEGRSNFVCRIFTMFMSMDKMVGKDFEKGLSAIKLIAERPAAQPAAAPAPALVTA